ncbi:PREDICTED: uncharacterized protein LOC106324605 [Brassica oleracea var. oleracea]|uniref:uncharacterized protein LOC106324605 n=1 Tax=Brassica oleracea var. oleracea TaxID=109376 RepID=UPI0006A6BAF9|nr:PREDICTED: uncharacterized protein LOC106324605 [Brassica oleracea var. oleracea]
MGKRNCKSKFRRSSPDLPDSQSPMTRDMPSGSRQPRDIIESPDRADLVRSPLISPVARFEVSDSPDNIHSPYHLLNSDHPGLVLAADPLDGSNYGVWIIAMTTSLEAKNKLGFVDGSIIKPSESDPYFRIWCRCNSMIKSWLLNSVTKQIYTSILYFKKASDIWADLHTRYHKSNLPRLYKLRHQLHSFKQGSMDLSSYHTKTQSLWEELSSLQSANHTIEDLLAERETNRIIDFLMGLNDNYENIRSRILMKKALPSFSEVFNLLDQEDSHRAAHTQTSSLLETPTVFQVSQSFNQNSARSSSGGYQRKDRPFCTFCHRPGHVIDRCYKKHGYPNSMKPNPKSDTLVSPLTELQLADPFTKPMYPAPFKRLLGKMGLLNIFVPS